MPSLRRLRSDFVWLLPALLPTAGLALLALVANLYFSLHEVRLGPGGETAFRGFSLWREVLADPRFERAFANTFFFVLLTLPAELVLGTALALLLHARLALRGLLRALALVPWTIPAVVVALFFRYLANDLAGPLAAASAYAGLPSAPLARPATAWAILALEEVWKTTPFVALILLAGLSQIPAELYEAAEVDGASPAVVFFRITLPLLAPAIAAAACLRALDVWRAFDVIYVTTNGGPAGATETLPVLFYQVLFNRLDLGRGSVLALVSVAGAAVLAVSTLPGGRLARR